MANAPRTAWQSPTCDGKQRPLQRILRGVEVEEKPAARLRLGV
jgi:hypothetical protein